MNIKALKSPAFTDDEQAMVVSELVALKKPQIQEFLARIRLPKSGTKPQFRRRIEEALGDGKISCGDIVGFLDEVIPWGKQHVYLYDGPAHSIANWKKPEWLEKLLKQHRLGKYLNARLPLALPESMKVSSIVHDGSRLRVTAIRMREWWERHSDYDETGETEEGEDLALHAFVRRVARNLVAFEWDLNANTAMLQISQLPGRFRYEEVTQEFAELIEGWLDVGQFKPVELRPAIKKLDELEGSQDAETRSHGVNYRTLQGRRLDAKSPSRTDPLRGEKEFDNALGAVRKVGIGHLGNFYFLPKTGTNPHSTPFDSDVHAHLVGQHNRINFPTPNGESAIRYVLSRIRFHSR